MPSPWRNTNYANRVLIKSQLKFKRPRIKSQNYMFCSKRPKSQSKRVVNTLVGILLLFPWSKIFLENVGRGSLKFTLKLPLRLLPFARTTYLQKVKHNFPSLICSLHKFAKQIDIHGMPSVFVRLNWNQNQIDMIFMPHYHLYLPINVNHDDKDPLNAASLVVVIHQSQK